MVGLFTGQTIIKELIELEKGISAELEEADEEVERGEFLTHEEVIKEIHSWREK